MKQDKQPFFKIPIEFYQDHIVRLTNGTDLQILLYFVFKTNFSDTRQLKIKKSELVQYFSFCPRAVSNSINRLVSTGIIRKKSIGKDGLLITILHMHVDATMQYKDARTCTPNNSLTCTQVHPKDARTCTPNKPKSIDITSPDNGHRSNIDLIYNKDQNTEVDIDNNLHQILEKSFNINFNQASKLSNKFGAAALKTSVEILLKTPTAKYNIDTFCFWIKTHGADKVQKIINEHDELYAYLKKQKPDTKYDNAYGYIAHVLNNSGELPAAYTEHKRQQAADEKLLIDRQRQQKLQPLFTALDVMNNDYDSCVFDAFKYLVSYAADNNAYYRQRVIKCSHLIDDLIAEFMSNSNCKKWLSMPGGFDIPDNYNNIIFSFIGALK